MKIADASIISDFDVPFMNLNRTDLSNPFDQFSELRLRIGIIDNPDIEREVGSEIDPLNHKKIINTTKGKFCVRWINIEGGLVRPEFYDKSTGDDDYEDLSDREPVNFTHAVMWSSDDNWMGLNYLPPVGSIVVMGFRNNNFPVMLGFLNGHYQVCEPLKLGEMMMKGYGNNYTHWKQTNEIENKVWINQDEKDGKGEYSAETIQLKIKLKASASMDDDVEDDENDPINRDNKNGLIELSAYNVIDGVTENVSVIEIKPDRITMISYDYEEELKESELKVYNKVDLNKNSITLTSFEKSDAEEEPEKSELILKPNQIVLNGNVKINGTLNGVEVSDNP